MTFYVYSVVFFLMGCNAIKEDNTKVYVDSYSQTALQQADIIMDGIQSENCEEIADIFCTYIKKNHPELQTDIKAWMKYIDGNIISYDPPTTERGSLNTGESGVEMLVMEADIDNVKTDTGKTYCIGMGSYSVFKNHLDCVGVTDLLIRDLDAEKENKEDSYSQTALQQADIIMDGIQSENCEEIADIFCTYIKKNHPELQTDIKAWMKYIDGNIISYDPPTTERGSLNTGESGVEMLVMEADIDNVKTDTGKTYCIGMGSYSVFKNHLDCVGVTDLLIRDLDAEKENKEDSQVRVEYDDIWTIEYGK